MAATQEVRVPDIGDIDEVEVVEVLVAPGDSVAADQGLITLESDKASMEIPSPAAGTVRELSVKVGDMVAQDAVILVLEAPPQASEPAPPQEPPTAPPEAPAPPPAAAHSDAAELPPLDQAVDEAAFAAAYASPGVRRLARELGVDLGRVKGTGRKGRTTRDDVTAFVKAALAGGGGGGVDGFSWPQMPKIDFAKFGPVEEKSLARIRRVSATNLHRSWLHVPHVTQHDEADITEMEAFRKAHGDEARRRGFKLTPVAFLMQAVAGALKDFPEMRSSLAPGGESLIIKHYIHLGIAVDTPNGLVVPVLRDVDKKGLFELAEELGEVSGRAREGKLLPQDFQGGCFTISSLGGIGGTAFTPVVNAPEVGILGVSRSRMQPVWKDGEFVPRLMLPLSLSYDHRVIDGAQAARFIVHLSGLLADLRRLLL